MMKRLSPKFVERAIVGIILLLPIFLLVGAYLAYLAGAHGNAQLDYASVESWFGGTFIAQIGNMVLSGSDEYGFKPINMLLKYLDDTMFSFNENLFPWQVSMYGYIWYAFHVILFDLIFHISIFFIRLIKNMLSKLEGDTQW